MTSNRKIRPVAASVATAVLLALAAQSGMSQTSGSTASAPGTRSASGPGSTGSGNATTTQQSMMVDMRASRLLGKDLRNAQGQELGEVTDLVVDPAGSRIHYAIVKRGGVLGIGDKELAIPVSQIRSGARDGELVLNLSQQQLRDAPGLERSAEWSDARTWDQIGQYYTRTLGMAGADRPASQSDRPGSTGGQTLPRGASSAPSSAAAGSASTGFMRASQLIGMDVLDSSGKEVGEIEDLVVNLSNGSVHYAVLEFDRAWNPVDKLVALPLSSLQRKADSNDMTINMSREQLANAPSFDSQKWPDLKDSQFRDRVGSFGRSSTTGMDRPGAASPSSGPSSSASPGSTPSPGAAPSPGATPSPGSGTGASGSAAPPLSSTGPSGSSSGTSGSGSPQR